MLSSLVESIHSDDLVNIVGAKTWVPQNFEDSEQATHSAIPVFVEDTEAYDKRDMRESRDRMSRAAAYRDSIEPTDTEFTEEELAHWDEPRFTLLPGEVVCNDGIIRPIFTLRDHSSRLVEGMESSVVEDVDESGLVTFTAVQSYQNPRMLAGIDPKLVPVGLFPERNY